MTEASAFLGRVGVVVAARSGSSRLPGKVLRPLGGKPMILFLLDRIRDAREIDAIVLATTEQADDDPLAELVAEAGFAVFRGAGDDVVKRYVDTAAAFRFDYVVRITGDCPFVDAASLDLCMREVRARAPFDIASTKGRFPVGIDYEIYNAKAMAVLHAGGELSAEDREHLTLFMYRHRERFKLIDLEPPPEWRSNCSFTVDTLDDYCRAEAIVARTGCRATVADVVNAA